MKSKSSRYGLVMCVSCETYVKSTHQTCPFCAGTLQQEERDQEGPMLGAQRVLQRRSKALVASLFGLSALGGVALSHCGGNPPPAEQTIEQAQPDGGGQTDAPVLPPYGIPPTEQNSEFAPSDAGNKPDNNTQQDTPVLPPYGIPPDRD